MACRRSTSRCPRAPSTAFLGPNGAGKTTSIRLLLGLLQADAGSIELFGEDAVGRSAAGTLRTSARWSNRLRCIATSAAARTWK
jgi:ABC-type uncharacterized transport system ATPase subunit